MIDGLGQVGNRSGAEFFAGEEVGEVGGVDADGVVKEVEVVEEEEVFLVFGQGLQGLGQFHGSAGTFDPPMGLVDPIGENEAGPAAGHLASGGDGGLAALGEGQPFHPGQHQGGPESFEHGAPGDPGDVGVGGDGGAVHGGFLRACLKSSI